MESEKRIVLICDTDKALVSTCETVVNKYPNTRLSIYYGQEDISAFLHKNVNGINAVDDMLIMMDSSCYIMTVEESINELRCHQAFREIPVLVLINEVDKNVMRSWYQKHIASVVLKNEDKEGMTYILNHIVDYWKSTSRLPAYTMPDPNRVFGTVETNLSFEL